MAAIREGKLGNYLLDNDRPGSKLLRHRSRRTLSRLKARLNRRQLLAYGVIHGHFLVRKYAFLYPEADFITFMREPVARTLSAYYYFKHVAARNPHTVRNNPRIPRIVEGRLDPVEFARDPHMSQLYRNYTQGLALDRFRLIGITERYAESLTLLNEMFAAELLPRHERRSDYQRFEAEYRHLLPDLKKANEENIEIYQQAVTLFEQRLKEVSLHI